MATKLQYSVVNLYRDVYKRQMYHGQTARKLNLTTVTDILSSFLPHLVIRVTATKLSTATTREMVLMIPWIQNIQNASENLLSWCIAFLEVATMTIYYFSTIFPVLQCNAIFPVMKLLECVVFSTYINNIISQFIV